MNELAKVLAEKLNIASTYVEENIGEVVAQYTQYERFKNIIPIIILGVCIVTFCLVIFLARRNAIKKKHTIFGLTLKIMECLV